MEDPTGKDDTITKDDLDTYKALHDAVEQAIRKNGSQYFVGRSECVKDTPLGGLLNQGATCYLNSLVQALFHARPFREWLYAWEFDSALHGEPHSCIPLQLQQLFARLQLSHRAASSTKRLTESFGWTAADSFHQHDAQELLHVLVDAIDAAATVEERAGKTSPLRMVCNSLRGTVEDCLQCCSCGYTRSRVDQSLDLELAVAGNATLNDAVAQFHAPELLTGADRWHCDRCACRRDTRKFLTIQTVPDVLFVHLKRFAFDITSMRRVKLSDSFRFPLDLPLGDLVRAAVNNRAEDSDGAAAIHPDVAASHMRLVSVLIHTGSALGGHYFAYANPLQGFRSDHPQEPVWVELNDAGVRPLQDDARAAFDAVIAAAEPEAAATEPDPKKRPVGVEANAYLLVYARTDPDTAAAPREVHPHSEPPAAIVEEVESENALWERLCVAYRVRTSLCRVHLHWPPTVNGRRNPSTEAAPEPITVDAPLTWTTAALLDACVEAIGRSRPIQAVAPTVTLGQLRGADCARLRRWNPATRRPAEPIHPEEVTLREAGLGPSADLVLDVKADPIEEWEPFDPDAMELTVVLWDSAEFAGEQEATLLQQKLSKLSGALLTVPGGRSATCASLATAIACSDIAVPIAMQKAWFMHGDNLHRVDVAGPSGPDTPLCDLGVCPGAMIVLDVGDAGDFQTAFEAERSTIRVLFNDPSDDTDPPVYKLSVIVSKKDPLRSLKRAIAGVLGDDVEECSIFLTRNARSKERLRHLDTIVLGEGSRPRAGAPPIDGLGLVDGSIVHVRLGRQLEDDEHMVSFVAFDPSSSKPFSPLCSLPVRDSATVASVRRTLRDALVQVAAAEGSSKPPPLSRLRLRDKTRTLAGKILRDPQVLRSALPRISDGYEIAVQRLAEPERVGPRDIVVAARKWNPRTFKLSPVTELVIDKNTTLHSLRAIVGAKFNIRVDSAGTEGDVATRDVSLAKHSQFGPPLKGATAGDVLSWSVAPPEEGEDAASLASAEALSLPSLSTATTDDVVDESEEGSAVSTVPTRSPEFSSIVAKPLALRDGLTLVVRDEREFLAAQADGVKPAASSKSAPAGGSRFPRRGVKPSFSAGVERGVRFRKAEGSQPSRTWSCSVCTFEQTNASSACEMCGSPA
jgi:ubiquitin C-terminal hydrolase